ncbi:hypothetical protein BRD13_06565 [Halobacteriales archaeon SW_5_70_135]|nr:MAG: hypothetical protein BRD13_06565 [Halobacteriales archaeon SW_5_70_135]
MSEGRSGDGSRTDGRPDERRPRSPADDRRRDSAEPTETSVPPAPRRLVYAEFALWVGLLTATLAALATVVGVTAGGPTAGGLGVAKTLLFALGFVLFGLGAIELRPPPAWKEERRFSLAPSGESRVDRLVRRLPPLNGRAIPSDQRVGRGVKWFAAGLLVLVVSYAMETVLGAGVGA